MHAHPCPGGHFRADALVGQRYRIISGAGDFAVVREAAAIARSGQFGVARVQSGVTGHRHHQNIAQIRMPRAREMGVRKAFNRRISVAIARRMAITRPDLAGCVGIGRQLHHAEGRGGAGEGMPFATGADHRVGGQGRCGYRRCYRRGGWLRLCCGGARKAQRKRHSAGREAGQSILHLGMKAQCRPCCPMRYQGRHNRLSLSLAPTYPPAPSPCYL